jgi:hypothetical protein
MSNQTENGRKERIQEQVRIEENLRRWREVETDWIDLL